MSTPVRLLIVEDDPSIRKSLSYVLTEEGYVVDACASAEEADAFLAENQVDLMILDIMLPGESGFSFCERLRSTHPGLPILILSALSEEASRVRGLDLGADDFISKPYSLDELLARVRALLRRSQTPVKSLNRLSFGSVVVDFERFHVERAGAVLQIPLKALQVLRYLSERPGLPISRDELLREVWGYEDIPMTRTVDNQVAMLRSQLEENPSQPAHILTVHGVGYKFEP